VPLGACFLMIALSAWFNLALRIRYPLARRLSPREAGAMLSFDVLQLAALLFLTGGLMNPFALMLLAPVMIAATALPLSYAVSVGAVAVVAATFLAVYSWPLPWLPGQRPDWPPLYVGGVWTALLLGFAFTGIYAWRVAKEARELADALAATELVLAREQHLSQLDGLAAAAAHELGTPLATIALVAKELDRPGIGEAAIREDVKLLREQAARCRDILGKLNALGSDGQAPFDRLKLTHLIGQVCDPLGGGEVTPRIESQGEGAEPTCRRNPGVVYGLENLIENAVDFARSSVAVMARWSADRVEIEIVDDGPGYAPDILMNLGEPYLTSRSDGRRIKGAEGGGLGLGLFIAKTLLERSGASVITNNVELPNTGARVLVAWPRNIFERDSAILPATM
jgi:two-component system sensor histidine kinase RegB